ncbi:MAG: class I SAM-dependent methyltransferase [Candidatus Thermoplasmatota archaeon]
MAIKDPETIKQIVRSNFDKSVKLYENFERKYSLFEYLTLELARVCKIRKGMNVCDIGCGTGSSSFMLAKIVGNEGKVIGVDFSEKMLDLAQEKLKSFSSSNIEFILCDADAIEENINFKLDSVLYNACIFLIPEPIKTLQSAYKILKENGTVGMNYLIGMYEKSDKTDNGLFQLAKRDGKEFAPYGRKIVDINIISDSLDKVGFRNIRKGTIAKEMSLNEMREFYSIPAQSAALYPKTPYEDRLNLIDTLMDYVQKKKIRKLYQCWGWYAAEKFLFS